MEPFPDRHGRRKSPRFPEWRTGREGHDARELLGTGQTNLSNGPDRTSESWRPAVVQKYLPPRTATGEIQNHLPTREKLSLRIHRRKFLQQTALSAAGLLLASAPLARARKISPNDKLNLGVIGVANRGHEDLSAVATE